jgi:phage portal protein BeeE
VCSTFHVPPWKVGIGAQPAYTKPEIANQAYYSDCLQSPIEQWELCMDEAFGFDTTTEGRWLGVELDLDGLLRMDAASQIETLARRWAAPCSRSTKRAKKVDQKPVAGGDSIWMQQQNYSLDALAERDRNDPFAPKTPKHCPRPSHRSRSRRAIPLRPPTRPPRGWHDSPRSSTSTLQR